MKALPALLTAMSLSLPLSPGLANDLKVRITGDLALEHLEIVLAEEPENSKALILKGNAHLLEGDEKQAREAFEKAAKASPSDPAALYQLATLNRLQHRYDDALVQLDQILQLEPGNVQALGAKVSVYMAQKQPHKALSFLDQKLREHESNARLAAVLFQMRGTLLFSQKEYKQSEADFKEALELDPELMQPYFSLARLYQVQGETEKAIAQYQALLDKQPELILAYMALGVLYQSQMKRAEARASFEKALEVNPDFAPAANNLAWILLEQGESPERALDLAKKAKAQLPDDPNVADTLGLALIRSGLYSSALSELNEAAAKLPENPTILYHLGLAHWKMGERDKAVKVLQKALKTKSDFPERKEAEKLLEEIRTERG